MKRQYDFRARKPNFNKGDAVWLYYPHQPISKCKKLQCNWDSPYLITCKLNDVLYRVQKDRRSKPKVVHSDRLRPYLSQDKPNWLLS
ncbi:hypothetical protein ACJMK2_015470 [Sinanodonta woodiana]|uniref:Integrase p58-like C-terminal domain-containing protein n=1 Tax=Sinanodonta woodiana TaxID=1069815 RepID=A0ABD3UQG2_SINWO